MKTACEACPRGCGWLWNPTFALEALGVGRFDTLCDQPFTLPWPDLTKLR